MLLEFKAKNYKSFRNELVFSLIPAQKQKGLDYSVLQIKIEKKDYKGLCSAVIYGPNASGKTNIIGAMDTFKAIVMRGNIRNEDDKSIPNAAANALELIPNNNVTEASPVFFVIKFIEENLLIEYSFEASIGKFIKVDAARRILSETLSVNGEMVFSMNDSLKFGSFTSIKSFLVNAFEENAEGAASLAKSNLNEEELFLVNGFKTMFSAKLAALINNWLDSKFMIIYRADSLNLIRKFSYPKKKSIYIEKTLNEAATYFGINSGSERTIEWRYISYR